MDVIVRGEGDVTSGKVVRAIESGAPLSTVAGIWYRDGSAMHHNPPRGVASLDDEAIMPPKRSARVLSGYTMMGRTVDVVETSRGCTFDCSFCSIIEMRGRNFHRFPIPRVLDDIGDARARGARAIFFVDDNITLDVPRFEALCRAIIDRGLNDVDYIVQGMTAPIAAHGDTLVPLMKKAGFRYVFLGIENILEDDLSPESARQEQPARARPARRQRDHPGGRRAPSPRSAGGRRVNRRQSRRHARRSRRQPRLRAQVCRLAVHPASDAVPGTPMTREFVERQLIANSTSTSTTAPQQ